MSWAEIKKAVNSRMTERPLDDMFGLQYVTGGDITQVTSVTYTGKPGFALIGFNGSYSNAEQPIKSVDAVDWTKFYLSGGTTIWIPFSHSIVIRKIYNSSFVVCYKIFELGGGI